MFNFLNNNVPQNVAFYIAGVPIMWYAICIVVGMLAGTLLMYIRASKYHIKGDDVLEFFIWCIPVAIIGARLYYVIFNWDYYRMDLLEILNIRHGGLAIHGGLIFGIFAVILLAKRKSISVLSLLDLVMPSVALGQAAGRWGNYFNQEAHGGPTSLPWAIPVDGQMVHPTFLYESIWCLLICIILVLIDKNKRFRGQIFLLYWILYSLERFFVEALRTDSLMIGSFRQAQVISAVAFVISVLVYLILYSRSKGGYKRRSNKK